MGVIPQGLRTTRERSRVPSKFKVKDMDKHDFVKAFNEGKTLVKGEYSIRKGCYTKPGCFTINLTKVAAVDTNDNFIILYAGKDRHELGTEPVTDWVIA
jgi:hypothetical protein